VIFGVTFDGIYSSSEKNIVRFKECRAHLIECMAHLMGYMIHFMRYT